MSHPELVCGSEAHLLACTASGWKGGGRQCRWCDADLPARRLRWCSDACVNAHGRNHWWTSASPAARERDGCCLDCGIGLGGLEVHHVVPLHTLKISVRVWVYARQEEEIVERRVRHSDGGCWHHLDGLRTLCKRCHLAAHAALRAEALGPQHDQLALGL